MPVRGQAQADEASPCGLPSRRECSRLRCVRITPSERVRSHAALPREPQRFAVAVPAADAASPRVVSPGLYALWTCMEVQSRRCAG